MDSDSESQDSDEGRRFRFETTRKDGASLSHTKRKSSPQASRRRSRSRDRNYRDERSKYSRDESSHRSRPSSDKDSNDRHSTKDRSGKDVKSSSRESSSRRQHDKESRSHRSRDSKGYDSRESRDSRDSRDHSNNKHKSKSRDKHKRWSRDRSREKNSQVSTSEEISKNEDKKTDVINVSSHAMETEEIKSSKPKSVKKQHTEDTEKVNDKSVDKVIESDSSNSIVISDNVMSQASTIKDSVPPPKKSKSFFDRVVNKRINDVSSSYGPVLPPKLEKKILNERNIESDTTKSVEQEELLFHKLVSNNENVIGPTLPLNLRSPTRENSDYVGEDKEEKFEEMEIEEDKNEKQKEEDEDEDAFGPILPPHMSRREVVGPMLPENFVPNEAHDSLTNPKSDDEESDDIVGPLPPDHAAANSLVQMQLEHRARQIKAKFRDKTSPEKNKREEWMVELPPAHAVALGLGSIPRKFKTSEGPDMSDRSMWTDTPADRLRKQKEKEELSRFVPSEESCKKSKKSKDKDKKPVEEDEEEKCESLLDMHLKTMKRKKKKLEKEAKELGLPTRRPFDRDIDLQVNRLDDARKKKIFEKASRLNDRFTAGKI